MKAVSRDFLESVKDYVNGLPEVELMFPQALELVLKALEDHQIPPAMWISVGHALSDEGAYRVIASMREGIQNAFIVDGNDKLQPTENDIALPEEV